MASKRKRLLRQETITARSGGGGRGAEKYLLGLADRWLFKGAFIRSWKRNFAHGSDPGLLAELVRLRGRDQ